jgi:hypothetical protein
MIDDLGQTTQISVKFALRMVTFHQIAIIGLRLGIRNLSGICEAKCCWNISEAMST